MRRVVDEEPSVLARVKSAAGRESAAQAHLPAIGALTGAAIPVGLDNHGRHHQHVARVGPLVDGLVEAVEVLPPERLVFAAVVVDGRGGQGDRRLVGGAMGRVGVLEPSGERPVQRARLEGRSRLHRVRRRRRGGEGVGHAVEREVPGREQRVVAQRDDAVLGTAGEQPVAQS